MRHRDAAARRPGRPRSRRRTGAARRRGSAAPTACAMRPQFGSPPCSAAFTSGELATARATRSTVASCAAVDVDAAGALRALAVADDLQREPAQRVVERLAEAQLVLALRLDDRRRSRPTRSGSPCRWSTAGRRRRCGRTSASRRRRAAGRRSPPRARRPSGRSRASSRSRAGSSRRPSPARSAAPCRTAARRRARAASGTRRSSRSRARTRRRRRAPARRARRASPSSGPSSGSGTPITPVDATATWSSRTPDAIAPAPCIRAASSSPRRPVAAFALPELTTTARSASSRQRSRHSSTGAAGAPERVKRAALTASGSEQTSSAEVGVAGRLDAGRRRRRRGSPPRARRPAAR